MNLIDTYKSILATAKLVASDDGYVSSELMGNKKPYVVDGKRLVLPIGEQLRNPDRESRIVFHPLRENPLQPGESDVLAAYRAALNMRLNGSIALLVANMVRLATSVAEHKKLNPNQSEYLSHMKNVDEKTFTDLAKLIDSMPLGQTKKAFISIYLRKGPTLNGRKYKKGGMVSFPFYRELVENKNDVFGVKIRQKDRAALISLMEYVFPDIDKLDQYSSGSGSDIAPSLEAIMGAVKNVGAQINEHVEMFKDVFDETDEIQINSDWVEIFDNVEQLLSEIRLIPTQFGNEGKVVVKEVDEPKEMAKIPIKDKMTFEGMYGNPITPSAPVQQSRPGSRGISLSDAMGSLPGSQPSGFGQPSIFGGQQQPQRVVGQINLGGNGNSVFGNQGGFVNNSVFGGGRGLI